jgi:glutathione S-transferase
MKLLYAPSSPFVRKVWIVALELGLDTQIERIASTASPIKPNQDLSSHNPLGKLPTLIRDDGTTLFGSAVLCDYLGAQLPGNKVVPTEGESKWRALRDQCLADGLLDAALLVRYELIRPEESRWDIWTDGQMAKIVAALDAIEHDAKGLGERVDVGSIAIGCALGYLDFRFAALEWRKHCPVTSAWFQAFAQRPSFTQTQPA